MIGKTLCAALTTLLALQAQAALPQHPELDLATARQLLDAASCNAAMAALDRGGNPLLLQRAALTGPHNLEAARLKAYTALSTKTPTRLLAERAGQNPETANLVTVPGLLLLGGGVPLYQGSELVGALGVAGAGGPRQDEQCAAEAAAKLGLGLHP
ncbi:GlcG/HbpS family heme-binding protein [Pseudomonas sp. DC3200b2]|uniref:GlcG/HbpS family heme-binding protein n=1 Tax=Pseudomonas sp. DC3200b2 TaxID=2804669 RepID=UPI003CEA3A99